MTVSFGYITPSERDCSMLRIVWMFLVLTLKVWTFRSYLP